MGQLWSYLIWLKKEDVFFTLKFTGWIEILTETISTSKLKVQIIILLKTWLRRNKDLADSVEIIGDG